MSGMERALSAVLEECLAVQATENVLVLTDPAKRAIAQAIVTRARSLGAETLLVEMEERETHGEEPPDAVAAAMLECDVFIAPTSKSVSHTEARHAATSKGVRAATMPDITEDMLVRTMSADYGAVRKLSRALADMLTAGKEVHIATDAGTDVVFAIQGRTGLADDGDLRDRGAFGNLPAGEGFIAPLEGATRGRIVFDGSIWPIGKLAEPLTVDIEDGYAVSITGGRADEFRAVLEPRGPDAFAVAELGIGTNDAAILTGNVLEDEKILGTIHVAFGDNHSFGGDIRVASHQDGIVLGPTVAIDAAPVMAAGRLQI